ncbi:hypothetical protein D3C72_2520710 [compost metagenome]
MPLDFPVAAVVGLDLVNFNVPLAPGDFDRLVDTDPARTDMVGQGHATTEQGYGGDHAGNGLFDHPDSPFQ